MISAVLALALAPYNPLALPDQEVKACYYDVEDKARRRVIPVKVYTNGRPGRHPVVLFSHGLGGSREGSSYLGDHWALRGYVVVCLQHPGSDTSVWQGVPARDVMKRAKEAASAENFMARVGDVKRVIDWLGEIDLQKGPLMGSIDASRIGMSGHSFGAVTTQAVSGQNFGPGGKALTDGRIKAAIAFSPSVPVAQSAEAAFGRVSIPWMVMTGTEDSSPIRDATPESRLKVYPALPAGDKYELVLYGAQHLAFTDRITARGDAARNPSHHRAIQALSTAFWDAYVAGSSQAKDWLKKESRSVLEPRDVFLSK